MTRRELWNYILQAAAEIYDPREARAITSLFCNMVCRMQLTDVIIEPDSPCPAGNDPEVLRKIEEIRRGRPIQYILGRCTFYGMEFQTSEGALIPRPETEELVQWILDDAGNIPLNILDIGTGSGCIAVTLAKNLPHSEVTGIDISPEALHIAVQNNRLHETAVKFCCLDILRQNMEEKFDIIVSNPPYVTEQERLEMKANVLDYEPPAALFVPDGDPLLFYRRIATGCSFMLQPGGTLYLEINEQYGPETLSMLKNFGFTDRELRHDTFGKSRMIRARKLS